MRGAVLALPQYTFMAWCSLNQQKQRDNFAFTSTSFKAFTAAMFRVVFWAVTPCSVVVGY
jgi:hypothetical protein